MCVKRHDSKACGKDVFRDTRRLGGVNGKQRLERPTKEESRGGDG